MQPQHTETKASKLQLKLPNIRMIINTLAVIYVIMIMIHLKEDEICVNRDVIEVRKQPKK